MEVDEPAAGAAQQDGAQEHPAPRADVMVH
jgi:hypothetical protein